MIKRYHDFYGCRATIIRKRDQTYDLFIRLGTGKLLHKKNYATIRGARIGMSKWSNSWTETFG